MDKLANFFDPLPPSWTGSRPLPGGLFDHLDFEGELDRLRDDYPFLSERFARRLMRMYGNLGSKFSKMRSVMMISANFLVAIYMNLKSDI